MKLFYSTAFVIIMLLTACAANRHQVELKNQIARDSYSLGFEFGNNLKTQEIELDREVLLSAVQDAIGNEKPVLTPEEIKATMLQLRKKTMVLQDVKARDRAARNREEGETFLAGNRAKEGVKTLPSGLQYRVLSEGAGSSPKETDMVSVHYRGTLVNGTEFDNSYKAGEAVDIHVNGVIKGWTEALQLMQAGAKWQVFVPAQLAYGERQYGRIPANSALIFEIELLSVKPGDTQISLNGNEAEGVWNKPEPN